MKTKDGRIAKRRVQRRARREERLRQQARLGSLGSTDWWDDGLEDSSTEQIVETLAKLGIQTDEGRFRELAHAHGDVDGIAGAWLAQIIVAGTWEDYPWLAARALWARWVPDLFSADVFVEEHLDLDIDEEDPETPEEGERHWQMAQAVMDVVAPREGLVQPDLLQKLNESSALVVDFWLANLPLSLERLGMVDEALEICARMAPVYEPENFLSDRADILARAGRREDAVRQVEANQAQFPDDVWVRINAGEVYEELGQVALAEMAYRHALAMTDALGPSSERSAAVERLMHLLQKAGRTAEVAALFESREFQDVAFAKADSAEHEYYEGLHEAEDQAAPADEADQRAPGPGVRATRQPIPKVGRNEPCPCGSGKKYKRCCGR